MSRLLQKLAPVVRRVGATQRVATMPKRNISMDNVPVRGEESEYIHARDQLLGVGGCSIFMAFAGFILAGEHEHEEEHPYYAAPYQFVKRGAGDGAAWWPGRHCQFFEFNCFAAAYKEADELLKATEEK